eukprot:TRINITY_DN22089_c0_g2_i3.p1 TRINITY_DN22089_c0_g2~~TRINITY_DN22089_c0_g2_i3.p1  ORF type:complete len:896 (+),score=137.76 TRINITY_DN22089_c0_g2_i3:77-2764(+)
MAAIGELVEVTSVSSATEDLISSLRIQPADLEGQHGRVLGPGQRSPEHLVATFDGNVVSLPATSLRSFQPRPAAGGHSTLSTSVGRKEAPRFDLVWPSTPEYVKQFQSDLAEALRVNSFCLTQTFSSKELRQQAVDEAFEMKDWSLPDKEYEVPYLGYQNSTKHAILPMDGGGRLGTLALAQIDELIMEVGVLLAPLAESTLGCSLHGKQGSMVRIPLGADSDENRLRPAERRQSLFHDGQAEVFGHLNWMGRRRLCVMFFVENDGGEVVLHPSTAAKGSRDIRLSLAKNQLLVFLPDQLGYTYRPLGRRSLVVQSFFLTKPYLRDPGDYRVVDMPIQFQGERVHVKAMNMLFPGGCSNVSQAQAMWTTGTDCAVKLPFIRWDVEPYYSPEKFAKPLYTCHSSCFEDGLLFSFDNDFFGISYVEAELMSFSQRKLLEVGTEALYSGGYPREACRGLEMGVYTGDAGDNWMFMPTMLEAMATGSNKNVHMGRNMGVNASRLSHIMGLRGPAIGIDTACSSSLVAMSHACRTMVRSQPGQPTPTAHACDIAKSLVMGVNLCDGYATIFAYCAATMLSDKGRCFTFDEAANGFSRGEGIGALFLQLGSSDEEAQSMYACVIGSATNQDGRSASMTAPHGPSQQQCIRASMREAGLKPSQINIAECHGTGTALGDPIEVGALRDVMKDRDEDPIIMTSGKSNFGHLEACAGLGGIVKCVLMLNGMTGTSNVHLRALNPHIDHNGYPAVFIDDMVDINSNNRGVSGVSSFGVGGTNARGDLWARCSIGHKKTHSINTFNEARLRSALYERVTRNGAPGPAPGDQLFLVRANTGWSKKEEMEGSWSSGSWQATFKMGKSGSEKFRIILNGDASQAFYPGADSPDRASYDLGCGPDWGFGER